MSVRSAMLEWVVHLGGLVQGIIGGCWFRERPHQNESSCSSVLCMSVSTLLTTLRTVPIESDSGTANPKTR